jgi:hypothetical protein
MAKAKSRPKNPFIGTWHIISLSNWDEDQLHEETDAFIEFDEDGGGSFEFRDIHGFIDHYRTKKRDRQRAIQFGWQGEDEEGMPIDDIGWAILEDGELRGTICLHLGEVEVEFVAKEESQKTSARGEQQRTQEKPKLKLGKSSAFVKTKLKQLKQGDDTWEADFPALPKSEGETETHYLGLVVANEQGNPLVCLPVDYTPNVNDLADLLAAAMRRPMTDSPHRPRRILSRGNPRWEELFPHLSQLGIEVSIQEELPHVEEVYIDFVQQMRKARTPPLILYTPSPTNPETDFPFIARWVQGYGHIEIGDQQGFGFVVRALDYGGLVFEDGNCSTLVEAMAALEKGLADWFEKEGMDV